MNLIPSSFTLHDDEAKNSFLSQVGHLKPETTLLSGQEEIQEVLKSDNVDMVVAAMVGVAGLVPVYHAVKSGKACFASQQRILCGRWGAS